MLTDTRRRVIYVLFCFVLFTVQYMNLLSNVKKRSFEFKRRVPWDRCELAVLHCALGWRAGAGATVLGCKLYDPAQAPKLLGFREIFSGAQRGLSIYFYFYF
jgi:hypothetical protein